MWPALPWYQNQIRTLPRKKLIPQSLFMNINSWYFHMNTYANILNKILASQIQQYLEVIAHCDQVGFILERQGWFNIHKPCIQYLITIKDKSICDWCTNSILQDSTAVYEENKTTTTKNLSIKLVQKDYTST